MAVYVGINGVAKKASNVCMKANDAEVEVKNVYIGVVPDEGEKVYAEEKPKHDAFGKFRAFTPHAAYRPSFIPNNRY
jgi:hypothetical protein